MEVGTKRVPVIVPEPGEVIAQLPVMEKIAVARAPHKFATNEHPVSWGLKPEPLTVTGKPGPALVGETEMVGVVTVNVWIAAGPAAIVTV